MDADPKFQSTPSGGKATAGDGRPGSPDRAFQSTPSGGKATVQHAAVVPNVNVSIHAFRGEGDRNI